MSLKLPKIQSYEDFEKIKSNTTLWKELAHQIIKKHGLSDQPLCLFSDGSNIVFKYGTNQVIKIFVPALIDQYKNEKLVLKHISGKLSISTPQLFYSGEFDQWPYIIMSYIEGCSLEGLWEKLSNKNKIIIIQQLGKLIREMHSLPIQGLESMGEKWDDFLEKQKINCVRQHQSSSLPDDLIQEIPSYIINSDNLLPKNIKPVLLTGEYTPMNLIVKKDQKFWNLHGLIDFGDSMLGAPEYDLLGPGYFLIQGNKKLAQNFLTSYGFLEKNLNSNLSQKLTALSLLHKYSNLKTQIRIPNWQNKVSQFKDLERLIWGF